MSEERQEQHADSSTTADSKQAKAPRRGARGLLRFLLLLLVAGGLAAGGWFGWHYLQKAEAYYVGMIESQRQDIRELRRELAELGEASVRQQNFREAQDAIAMSQDGLRDQLEALAVSVEDLRDAAQGGRRDLLQAEIEFLLRIAADELYLTGDVNTAIYALQSADDRLRALESPRLNPVREAIAEHLTALNAVAVPDTTGMALKLGSLMQGVKALPLQQSAPLREQAREQAEREALGWWERIKAGTERLFSKLVRVDRAEPPPPLLTPEEHFFLYRNVELQFAAARAALLQGNAEAYRQSLETAREWINRYFDTGNAQVVGVLDDVNRLLSISLQPDLPDISRSLQLFRRLTESEVAG